MWESHGLLAGCFTTWAKKEMKLISGEIMREEDLKEDTDIGGRRKLMAFKLIVPVLSWSLNLEFSYLSFYTLEGSYIDVQYSCTFFCLYGDLLWNLTSESYPSQWWILLLVKSPLISVKKFLVPGKIIIQ